MASVKWSVPNISCQHCVRTITNELRRLPGVSSVAADATTKIVTVDFGAPATEGQIRATLTEIGYPPQVG